MAENEKNNRVTVFSGVFDALNTNRRKKSTIDPQSPGMGVTQAMPSLNPRDGIETMQQQYLDWQVFKTSHDLYTRTIYYDTDRISAYQDFRAMDGTPEIAAALNIIRDECLTRSERGNILEVYSENKRVKQVLNDLFKNVLNVDFNLRLWIRDLVKYGDYFVYLEIDREVGIYDFLTLPMEEVHREEGYDGKTSSIRFRWETTGDYFEEWQIAHFRLLEDSRKLPYGRCLKFDTYIETGNGVKFIKDIVKGEKVFSFDIITQEKVETEVLDVICSGKKNIYKIRTKNNEIESSIEHKFLIYEDNKFVYKGVDELKINDLLVTEKENFNIRKKIKIDKEFIKKNINWNDYKRNIELIPDFVNEDFAKLFGFMLGDGWCSNNAVYIALGIDEKINSKYCNLLNKFSGKNIKLKENKSYKKTKFQQAHVNSRLLKEILINMGFAGKCFEKRLPEWIFIAPNNIKEALIEGILDADGSEFVDEWNCKRYSIELANEYLIKDLKILLQRMGRKCGKICDRDRKKTIIWGKEYNVRKSFYLYFYDSNIKQCDKYEIRNRKNKNFILTPIISIENTFEYANTYDIYVKNENHNFYANGMIVHNSILDSSRKLWKQLQLAEDAMLVYRITRAPDRRVFYVEVGNLPDADVKTYMGKVQNQIRKQPIIDVKTGNMTQKYDPENVTEDYWIPIRGDKSSRIETLPGAANLGDIHDIEYLQNKLFAALQVPKPYLNFGESMPGGSTLSQADIRFSRTINSIQEAILLELRRVANVHLYFSGLLDDIDNFQLTLTNPSTQQELLKLETMKARLEVFKEFFNSEVTSPTSYTWAMENILGFSKSDIKLILKQKKVEKKIFAEIDSSVETYKKIGLFSDLDDRYEDPEAAAAVAAGGITADGKEGEDNMGGGGGGLGGGLDLGGGGVPPMGGVEGETPEGETPEGETKTGTAAPEGEEEVPIKENKIVRYMKKSDNRMNNFINELLGPDEEIIKLMKEKSKRDNVLVKKNKSMSTVTKRLLESLDKTIINVDKTINEAKKIKNEKSDIINEEKVIDISFEDNIEKTNILFENNEKNNKNTKKIFDVLDEITSEE